jgi:hypothetical protein
VANASEGATFSVNPRDAIISSAGFSNAAGEYLLALSSITVDRSLDASEACLTICVYPIDRDDHPGITRGRPARAPPT